MIKSHAVCSEFQDWLLFNLIIYLFIYAKSNVLGQDHVNLCFAWQMNSIYLFHILVWLEWNFCTVTYLCCITEVFLKFQTVILLLPIALSVKWLQSEIWAHENVPICPCMYFCKPVCVFGSNKWFLLHTVANSRDIRSIRSYLLTS